MNQEKLFKIILAPVVSEKSAVIADSSNQVVFKVLPTAAKHEIKSAIEKLFDVSVLDVRTLNMKGKTKRTRFGMGKRSDWKKAYIRLAEGQEIDFEKVVAL